MRKRSIQSRRTYKDSTSDENLQAGRAGAFEQDADRFDVREGAPLVPRELHDLARHINSRCIDREEDFITFDYHLCRLSHARTLLDLCLGELLSAFRKADGKAYGEMGYSRLDDFADEHLSFSGRLASEMILNCERLQTLPLTREAYIKGDIVKSALRLLLRVASKDNEAELLSEIRELSVREIGALVKVKLRSARICNGQKNMAGGDASEVVAGKAGAVAGDVAGKVGATAGDVAGKVGATAGDAAEAVKGKAGAAAGDVAGKAVAAGDAATGESAIDSSAACDKTNADAMAADAKVDSAADAPGEDTAVAPKEGSDVVPLVAATGDITEPGAYQEGQIPDMQMSEEQVSEDQASEEIPSEESDREEGSGVVMKFNVPRTLALTWDFALEHFRENDRTKGPLYGFVEALVSCFLDSTADLAASGKSVPEAGADLEADSGACIELKGDTEASSDKREQPAESPSAAEPETSADVTRESGPASVGGREVPLLYTNAIWDCFLSERDMRASGGDVGATPSGTGDCRAAEPGGGKPEDSGDDYPNPQNEERLRQIREELALQPFVVKLPDEYSKIPRDSYSLAQKIIRMASMRQSIDYHIGWFLKAIRDRNLYRIMEFSKIEDYAKARINISASTTFRLIRLVSYFSHHPVIEKAFLRRKITREQAYQIASLEDGRHEKIWLDFAMNRPTRELRDEVNRMLRIKEYDYFAPHNYALLPGFRYITDDRYDSLSDEMKDILRTGAWYQGPGSKWPLPSHDEHYLDKDFADKVDSGSDTSRLSKCAANPGEGSDLTESSRLSKCAANPGESSNPAESSQLSKCAASSAESSNPAESSRLSKCTARPAESSDPAESSRLSKCAANPGENSDPAESSRLSKCAASPGESSDPTESSRLSKCAASPGEGSDLTESSRLSKCAANPGETGACQCQEGDRQQSDEALEQVRELCTLPDRHRPAATLLLDVLESLSRKNEGNGTAAPATSNALAASDSDHCHPHRSEPVMSIRFFIPRGLYGVWNEAVRRYVSLISPDDGVELLINNEGVENFLALLLKEFLLAEKAHHKAARNNKVLERDGYNCQVPGCSNRRNIHAHHLKFRSRGGIDAIQNMLCLCAQHHLWILHILHGLKIEGMAPDELTFTFGPCSSPEGEPFMIYSSGRKILSPVPDQARCSR